MKFDRAVSLLALSLSLSTLTSGSNVEGSTLDENSALAKTCGDMQSLSNSIMETVRRWADCPSDGTLNTQGGVLEQASAESLSDDAVIHPTQILDKTEDEVRRLFADVSNLQEMQGVMHDSIDALQFKTTNMTGEVQKLEAVMRRFWEGVNQNDRGFWKRAEEQSREVARTSQMEHDLKSLAKQTADLRADVAKLLGDTRFLWQEGKKKDQEIMELTTRLDNPARDWVPKTFAEVVEVLLAIGLIYAGVGACVLAKALEKKPVPVVKPIRGQ